MPGTRPLLTATAAPMASEENPRNIDWEQLATRLGAIRDDRSEHSSTSLARQAVEAIIGPPACRAAVDHYVSQASGAELARSVLWHIHPWSAMERCYEIYRDSQVPEERQSAIELLRVVADGRVLPWIPRFLADPDEGIQIWGAGIVDQLLWSRRLEAEDCVDILAQMEGHSNQQVRERHEFIRSYLTSREESA